MDHTLAAYVQLNPKQHMLSTYVFNIACDLLGKKWRAAILYSLKEGPLRFSEIKTRMPECSVKVLSENLKEMTEKGMLIRKQYEQVPVKVTYEVHPDCRPLVDALKKFYKASAHYIIKNATLLEVDGELLKELISGIVT